MVAAHASQKNALISSVNDLQLTNKFQLTKYALEVLASDPTEKELGLLFEARQFSPELEEYLFARMDESKDRSYVEVVKSSLTELSLFSNRL